MTKLSKKYLNERFEYVDGELVWRYNREARPQWNGKFVGRVAGAVRYDGRVVIRIGDKLYLRYRLIWAMFFDEWPAELDHINNDPTDDRIHNLREANRYINNQNTFATGVTKVRDRFWARIFRDGKSKSLGLYNTFEEAHYAYLEAKAQYEEDRFYDQI